MTEAEYPDPSEADLNDPTFNAVWGAIKGWDISRDPANHRVYSGATGNDVMRILLALRSAAPPSPPVAPEPAQEAGGVERVSHEVGTAEYWHDRFTLCLAMLEEAQGKQGQSEREAAGLREELETWKGIAAERDRNTDRAWADRDAERTQKEVLLGLLKEYEADLRERGLNAYADHLYRRFSEPAGAAPVALALEPMRLVEHALAAEPAPVAKAEAPSEPAGWVPKVGEMVRNTRWTEPLVKVLAVEEGNKRILVRSVDGECWYDLSFVEPDILPPATTGGALLSPVDGLRAEIVAALQRMANADCFSPLAADQIRGLAEELERRQP